MRKFICISSLLVVALCGIQAAQAATCNGVTANLVTNCGFETGTFSGYGGTALSDYLSGVDTGDVSAIGATPYQGSYEAFLGTDGTVDTLTQSLTTVAGQAYTIKFALLNDTSYLAPYTNSFSASFGSSVLLSETDVAADAYTLYTATGVATGTSTLLSFSERNDQGDFELDSISVAVVPAAVTATPEPGSFALLGTGMLSLAGMVRRRLNA